MRGGPDVFLALFFVAVAAFYTIRIVRLRTPAGGSPVHVGARFSRHWLATKAFHAFRWMIFWVCLIRLAVPEVDAWIGAIPSLMVPELRWIGCALMMVGAGGVLVSHYAMGSDWRSGVAADSGRVLLTGGPFAVCRHPVFSAVVLAQIGFVLALPSAFSLICLGAGTIALTSRTNEEEVHLLARHGEAFRRYAARTPRWAWSPRRHQEKGRV